MQDFLCCFSDGELLRPDRQPPKRVNVKELHQSINQRSVFFNKQGPQLIESSIRDVTKLFSFSHITVYFYLTFKLFCVDDIRRENAAGFSTLQ